MMSQGTRINFNVVCFYFLHRRKRQGITRVGVLHGIFHISLKCKEISSIADLNLLNLPKHSD
jgi:hypothetical protein